MAQHLKTAAEANRELDALLEIVRPNASAPERLILRTALVQILEARAEREEEEDERAAA